MDPRIHNTIVSFIWGIADDVLRDIYTRGKYRDVILPMTVIRRLDALLEPNKQAVLEMKKNLDKAKIANQHVALCQASGQAFYNTSPFTLRDLKARAKQQQLRADFEAYLDGFSPNVQEILDKFKFRNQMATLAEADIIGSLLEKFLDTNINLSPNPVYDAEGNIKLPALDNHSMGTIFEELIRRFNEENNEEAGEHFTPRDVVRLMANLIFLPIADQIESATYLVYDGACGTGGMLTVAEETLKTLAQKQGKEVAIHLYGQECQPETFAITKADLLLKGEGEEADNMRYGSTLSADGFPTQRFDFMLSNPPYGKSWKTDLDRMGGKADLNDTRFVVTHDDNPEYKMITRSSDGQLMFLVNKLSKMKHDTPMGSRIAEVHNGSSLFTGDAGQGESNIRRWIIENDWLEAIIALPENIFYNTGIATYIWVLTNRKAESRKGKVQLIDASGWFEPLRKNLGKKNCQLSEEHIRRICDLMLNPVGTEQSKLFDNAAFGYWKIVVERPLRLCAQFSRKAVESLRFASGDEALRRQLFTEFGEQLYTKFSAVKADVEKFLTADQTEDEEDGDSESDTPKKKAIPEKTRKKLLDAATWKKDVALYKAAKMLWEAMGDGLSEDFNVFSEAFDKAVKKCKLKLSASEKKAILKAVSWRDENAAAIIKKKHKDGSIDYEPDPDLRDTEQVPLLEDGGVEAFFAREVLPYVSDAWIDHSKTKIGYEISFTRHFYKPAPLRALDEIKADIVALEKETEGLLNQIVG